jgi:hypothetical protein
MRAAVNKVGLTNLKAPRNVTNIMTSSVSISFLGPIIYN